MTVLTLLCLCFSQIVLGIDIDEGTNRRDSRKLFGGYKITPRYCKPTRETSIDLTGPNICMFNHECTQRNGYVVGACMDGFLFGACCQLPGGTAGELMESDLVSVNSYDNNLYAKPTKTPALTKITPTLGVITSSGVSQITDALLNGVLPTAQDNEVVQVDHDMFGTTGVTHPTAPETILQNSYNEINAEDFRPSGKPFGDRRTTVRADGTTPAYAETSPYFNNPSSYYTTYKRPIFVSRPSDNDKYVLVPTITHATKPNKTQEVESIVNIIHMLNGSTSYYGGSTQSYSVSTTKKTPSSSYQFTVTPTYRPTVEPLTSKVPPSTSYISSSTQTWSSYTKTPSTSYVYSSTPPGKRPGFTQKVTTKKPPSTSYVFSTTAPPRRPEYTQLTTQNRPSTHTTVKPTKIKTKKPISSTTPDKKPSYISSSTFRPAHSTFANSPTAFITSKKPPSTSYVYSPTVTKRPTTNANPSYTPTYSVTPSSNIYSTYPSIPPTVILLSPATPESSTRPSVYSQSSTPQRKPVSQVTINNHVTHNIYSTSEKPSPAVLITPKPSSTSNPIRPITDPESVAVEAETSADDLNNFPPVRNPNLNMSIPVFDENDITTPVFIEDEALNIKVESFVNNILQGLQEPFHGLKGVVYNNNKTAFLGSSSTKKPTRQGTSTKKPATRPGSARPTQQKLTTRRPATSSVTKKPSTPTNKRTKPTKKATTVSSTTIEDTLSATNQDYKHSCGVRPLMKSGRIVGGKGATFGEFPWQVLVRESTWLGLFTKNKCGGVLISNRYVMTAAHCQPGFLASLVAVFGEYDISGNLESKRPLSRNVKRVIVHRNYDAATFENDLALLELEHPVQFDQHIIPICLPREGEDFTGRMATVTGWGRLKYGGGVPSVLQEVQVPIMENHVCQEMFRTAGHSKVILESFLCAGYANGQKDSCEGDSGGPLVLQRPDGRYQLAGTVSHGIKCAAPYLPGVYMRTAYFKPWIETITGVH